MNVLITGSAGFVGSHLVDHILENTSWRVIGLDSFRHRGDSIRVRDDHRYRIYKCDLSCPISDRVLREIKQGYGDISYVINMASESHVDRSISDPVSFIQNNVNLALYVYEMSLKLDVRHVIQISTDEVYGPAVEGMKHKEWSEILPSNPYSASKAAQEAIAISYWRTFSMPLTITNTMNMIGERQDGEKFIPTCIRKIINNETVKIHGSSAYVGKRHYLHARNLADALVFILQNHPAVHYEDPTFTVDSTIPHPERWNIVGDVELDNLQVAQHISSVIGKPLKYEFEDFHSARPGHDRRYALCGDKLKRAGWKAPVDFYTSLEKTVKWYLENPNWLY